MKSLVEIVPQKKITSSFARFLLRRLDLFTLYPRARWVVLAIFLSYTIYRVIKYKCFGVICFLFFYIIYLTLQYLTPSGLPQSQKGQLNQEQIFEESEIILPCQEDDRPLLRVLNEFDLWKQMLGITLVSLLCTTFKLITFPIQTPLLIGYLAWLIWLAFEKYHKQMKLYGFNLKDLFLGKRLNIQIVNN